MSRHVMPRSTLTGYVLPDEIDDDDDDDVLFDDSVSICVHRMSLYETPTILTKHMDD